MDGTMDVGAVDYSIKKIKEELPESPDPPPQPDADPTDMGSEDFINPLEFVCIKMESECEEDCTTGESHKEANDNSARDSLPVLVKVDNISSTSDQASQNALLKGIDLFKKDSLTISNEEKKFTSNLNQVTNDLGSKDIGQLEKGSTTLSMEKKEFISNLNLASTHPQLKDGDIRDKNISLLKEAELTSNLSPAINDTKSKEEFYMEIMRRFPMNLNPNEQSDTGKEYRCEKCDFVFPDYACLLKHCRLAKHYSCEVCFKNFGGRKSMVRHLKQQHSILKPHICELCEKPFERRHNLILHQKSVHIKLKPFKCEVCDHTFTCKGSLKKHFAAVHSQLKLYTCADCDKSFTRKDSLTLHQNFVHLKLRPFKCDSCDSMFTSRSNLYTHQKTHTDLKPYVCPVCKKAFRQKEGMLKHAQREHNSIRPVARRGPIQPLPVMGSEFSQPDL